MLGTLTFLTIPDSVDPLSDDSLMPGSIRTPRIRVYLVDGALVGMDVWMDQILARPGEAVLRGIGKLVLGFPFLARRNVRAVPFRNSGSTNCLAKGVCTQYPEVKSRDWPKLTS